MSHLKDRLPVPVRSSYPLPSNQLNAKNGCRRNAPLYPYLKSKLYATVIYSNVTLEYPELPKGDMTTPTLGFLLRPYTIIIHQDKNYIKKYGVQSSGSRTKAKGVKTRCYQEG